MCWVWIPFWLRHYSVVHLATSPLLTSSVTYARLGTTHMLWTLPSPRSMSGHSTLIVFASYHASLQSKYKISTTTTESIHWNHLYSVVTLCVSYFYLFSVAFQVYSTIYKFININTMICTAFFLKSSERGNGDRNVHFSLSLIIFKISYPFLNKSHDEQLNNW